MLINDCGYSVGPKVKAYMQYGNKQKQDIQGQNMCICKIDETRLSQKCVYCFSQLAYPVYQKLHKGKVMKAAVKRSFCLRKSSLCVD
jgi:hypothetical protein